MIVFLTYGAGFFPYSILFLVCQKYHKADILFDEMRGAMILLLAYLLCVSFF